MYSIKSCKTISVAPSSFWELKRKEFILGRKNKLCFYSKLLSSRGVVPDLSYSGKALAFIAKKMIGSKSAVFVLDLSLIDEELLQKAGEDKLRRREYFTNILNDLFKMSEFLSFLRLNRIFSAHSAFERKLFIVTKSKKLSNWINYEIRFPSSRKGAEGYYKDIKVFAFVCGQGSSSDLLEIENKIKKEMTEFDAYFEEKKAEDTAERSVVIHKSEDKDLECEEETEEEVEESTERIFQTSEYLRKSEKLSG